MLDDIPLAKQIDYVLGQIATVAGYQVTLRAELASYDQQETKLRAVLKTLTDLQTHMNEAAAL